MFRFRRFSRLPLLLVLTVLVGGCTGPALTIMYLMGGMDIQAEYKGLKGKRVAIVCRPVASTQYQNPNVAHEIARQVARLIKKNVSKVEIIDYRKVADWTDNNTWEEFIDIGDALEADRVIGIDLESFDIFQGQTLYQGRANCIVKVFDCTQEDVDPVYEKVMPPIVYPPNTGIPTSEKRENSFPTRIHQGRFGSGCATILQPRSAYRLRVRFHGVRLTIILPGRNQAECGLPASG